MKIAFALLFSFVFGAYASHTVTTTPAVTRVRASSSIALIAGDRVVCAVNPTAYTVHASSPSLVDYTVGEGHSFVGVSVLNGIEN
jgi:hypothetical protein